MYINIKSSCKKIPKISQTPEVNKYTACDFSIFVKFKYDNFSSKEYVYRGSEYIIIFCKFIKKTFLENYSRYH